MKQAIESVLNQNYCNLEYIILDGGSRDSSIKIIQEYNNEITYWESRSDGGQAAVINKGWQMSNGDIFGWLNSDDFYSKKTFETLVKAMVENPDGEIFIGNCAATNKSGRIISIKNTDKYDFNTLLNGRSLGQPSVFIKKRVLQNIGYLNANLHWCLDWAFFIKVLYYYRNSNKIIYINKVLSFSREYEGTKTNTGLDRKGKERRAVLKSYFREWLYINYRRRLQAYAATYIVQALDQYNNGAKFKSFISILLGMSISPFFVFNRIMKKINT